MTHTVEGYVNTHYGQLVGKRVAQVRLMADEDKQDFGWGPRDIAVEIIMSDGTVIIPSQDPEATVRGTCSSSRMKVVMWIITAKVHVVTGRHCLLLLKRGEVLVQKPRSSLTPSQP